MARARRRRHEQLAVVQLVAPPVGRQCLVVPVGEDDSRRHLRHPDRKSITPSVVAGRSTDWECLISQTAERGVKPVTGTYWLGHGSSYPCSYAAWRVQYG